MQLESLSFYKNYYWLMVDGVTEELVNLSVTTSIKMSFWSFVSYTSHFSMDFLDKYFSWIGCRCFIIYFGLPGHASSHMFLKEMWMVRLHYRILSSIMLVLKKFISISRNFGSGCSLPSFMDGSAISCPFMVSMESKMK